MKYAIRPFYLKVRCVVISIVPALFFAFVLIPMAYGQNAETGIEFNPRNYLCYKTSAPLKVDGMLNDESWKKVRWTDNFIDIEGNKKPIPRYKTRVKMLWDETYFYVAAHIEEPHVWATLTQRDTVIFYDNDFEVFIDPDGDTHQYYELEVNALGTVWDLMLTKPYRDGGMAIDSWDIQELKVGVDVGGTLNNPSDIDSGWTVELAFPWKVLEEAAPNGQKPSAGDQWRINFSRVQWKHRVENGSYTKVLDPETNRPESEDNWVWSPQGIVNMHYPETWGYVQFTDKEPGDQSVSFERQNKEYIKKYLRQLYYRQHIYKKQNGSFTSQPDILKAKEIFDAMKIRTFFPNLSSPRIYATHETFEIRLRDVESSEVWYMREDGRVWSASFSENK